jgi:tetratricopeptide (TPR) repeat protein
LKSVIKSLLFTYFSLAIAGCASKLSLSSNPPNAEVELISPQDQVVATLGTTPLLLTPDTLSEKQSSGPYVLRVTKEGYLSREILLVSVNGIQATVNLELRTNEPVKALNDTVETLFRAQELAQNGEYQAGLTALNDLQKSHPGILAIYEIKGSILMLKGDYVAAAREFQRATQFSPDNAGLRRLYETATREAAKSGARTPASEAPQKGGQ